MLYRLMFTAYEPFQLPPQERDRLQQIVRTTTLSAGLARRARVLLLLAEGVSLRQIQAQTGMSPRRIQHWKRSWQKKGLDGLLDAPRAGRPKKLTVAKEAAILAATEEHPPGSTTHWSTRRLARRLGVSNVTVMRVWHKAGLQPHRLRRYMASPDRTLKPRPKTSWVCICILRRTQPFFASTRRPQSRLWIAPNRRCRCDPNGRNGRPSSTCGTERSRCWPSGSAQWEGGRTVRATP